jgi:hypothetical protein
MIPSSWKSRRDRADFRSRSVGGVDAVLADLLDVAAAIHIESSLWPDLRAVDVYMSAWQIQTIAIHYARREVDRHTAETWIEAGNAYVNALRADRIANVQ